MLFRSTKVFWKGFALECVRATHGDHSMPIKTILTVLGRAMEETLRGVSRRIDCACANVVYVGTSLEEHGDCVMDISDTSALCGGRGSSR